MDICADFTQQEREERNMGIFSRIKREFFIRPWLGQGYSRRLANSYYKKVCIDLENDKQFSFNEGSTTQTGTDLLTFSFYSGSFSDDSAGYNSLGTRITGNDRAVLNPPTFTAPTTPGDYRIRFKVDWNSVDAGGQKALDGTCTGQNGILANGGYIVDAILSVVGTGTGILNNELQGTSRLYDLSGRRLHNAPLHGVFIQNGRKVVK